MSFQSKIVVWTWEVTTKNIAMRLRKMGNLLCDILGERLRETDQGSIIMACDSIITKENIDL